MNILVVDHSPIWRQLVRCVFEPEHTVIEREDVTDGLQACGVHRPDWVLINIDM